MITHVVVALDDFALRMDTEAESGEVANYLAEVGTVTQAVMREHSQEIEQAFFDAICFGQFAMETPR